ncbi:hypothetical protein BDZ91DRAFT_461249 [Kalaharituber pfeilii]|nr:hypothetical protein BDZ91DRAFT_461249 [Kalaharituber pfeilii]
MNQFIDSYVSNMPESIVHLSQWSQGVVYGALAGASALLVEIGIESVATVYLGRSGPHDGIFWSVLIRLAYGSRAVFEQQKMNIRIGIACGSGAILGTLEYCGRLDHKVLYWWRAACLLTILPTLWLCGRRLVAGGKLRPLEIES